MQYNGKHTIWIRKENEELWGKIADKSKFVNDAVAEFGGLPLHLQKPKKKPIKESLTISTGQVESTIDNPFSYRQIDKVDAVKGVLTDAPTCKHGMHPELCKHAKPGQKCK